MSASTRPGPRHIRFSTDDRDAAADAIEHAFGFRARLTGRSIAFRQQTVENAGISFTELGFGADLRSDVDPNPSFVLSEIPHGRYVIRQGRRITDLSDGGMFLLPTGSAMHVELDRTVTRTVNLGTVDEVRAIVARISPEPLRLGASRLRPASPAAERYLRESIALYRRHFLADGRADAGLAVSEARRHLVMTAVSAFGLLPDDDGTAPAGAVLRRVRAHVAEHLSEPLTVHDLAAAAGTGVRAVQLAFRHELGMTPTEYLREVRLAAARAELVAGEPAPAAAAAAAAAAAEPGDPLGVASVAARWGFSNAGRFSSSYLQRYDEYPSETLRRVRPRRD